MFHIIKHKKRQEGQVLLITAMLLASVVAVVLAVTFRSNTETQITKLEEESQKALAAAEAGIEAALRTKQNVDIGTLNISGFTGSATIKNSSSSNTFVSPTLEKDQQYTLYLTTYTPSTNTFSGSYASGNLTFYFGNDGNCPALAVTVFNTSGSYVKQRLIQPTCSSGVSGTDIAATAANTNVQGYNFAYNAIIPSTDLSSGNMAVVRMLSANPLNLSRFAVVGTANLPLQGSIITSEARSAAGVKKVIERFQSYPQIPMEFFVTSF